MTESALLNRLIVSTGTSLLAFPLFIGMLMIIFTGSGSDSTTKHNNSSRSNLNPVVEQAYKSAASSAPDNCQIDYTLIAAIGYVETRHGTYKGSTINENGDVQPQIIGIPLDGKDGTKKILDTDNGELDKDNQYDRAVGPMQFIPTSWQTYGEDGNNDGENNPHNIFDAAHATVNHLCEDDEPKDLINSDQT